MKYLIFYSIEVSNIILVPQLCMRGVDFGFDSLMMLHLHLHLHLYFHLHQLFLDGNSAKSQKVGCAALRTFSAVHNGLILEYGSIWSEVSYQSTSPETNKHKLLVSFNISLTVLIHISIFEN